MNKSLLKGDRFLQKPFFLLPYMNCPTDIWSYLSYKTYPGEKTVKIPLSKIVEDTKIPERTVQRHIQRLIKSGLLTIESKRGDINEYMLHVLVTDAVDGASLERDTDAADGARTDAADGATLTPQTASVPPLEERKERKRERKKRETRLAQPPTNAHPINPLSSEDNRSDMNKPTDNMIKLARQLCRAMRWDNDPSDIAWLIRAWWDKGFHLSTAVIKKLSEKKTSLSIEDVFGPDIRAEYEDPIPKWICSIRPADNCRAILQLVSMWQKADLPLANINNVINRYRADAEILLSRLDGWDDYVDKIIAALEYRTADDYFGWDKPNSRQKSFEYLFAKYSENGGDKFMIEKMAKGELNGEDHRAKKSRQNDEDWAARLGLA